MNKINMLFINNDNFHILLLYKCIHLIIKKYINAFIIFIFSKIFSVVFYNINNIIIK